MEKTEKSSKKKLSKGKKITISVFVIVAVLVALVFGIGRFMVGFVLDTEAKVTMKSVMTEAMTKMNSTNGVSDFSGYTGDKETIAWFKNSVKDTYITSEDGLKLHAYEIKNENGNGNYMISCHGYSSSSNDMANSAKHFYDMGYSVLLPDARAHGDSEGRFIGMGWTERKDILLWIDKLIEENSQAKIGLYGVSMGGATVMMTSGEELPEQVVVAVEDCGYSSVWDEFDSQLKSIFHLPSFPLLDAASVINDGLVGYNFKEASSVEQVKKCKIPMLFIHGDQDKFVPFEMLDKVYNAAECEKEKLVIKGADHAKSAATDPELYWSTVEEFLAKHMQ